MPVTLHLIMLPCFVLEQDRCQLDASWMSRSGRKWAPVRWTRSDRAPPPHDGCIMLIKPFTKAERAKRVIEGVIVGISVTDNKGLMCSDFNLLEVGLLSHYPLSSCTILDCGGCAG